MQMLEIKALDNGAHENQTYHGVLPEGWAVVPDTIEVPDTFPFVDIEVDGQIVTAMTAGIMPEPEPVPEPEPTQFDIIEAQVTYTAMMTDTLLEV